MEEQNGLEPLGIDRLKYRLSPWWRLPIPHDAPTVHTIRESQIVPEGYVESKSDETAARHVIKSCMDDTKVAALAAQITQSLQRLPEKDREGVISILYPRRAAVEQNWLTVAMVDELAERLTRFLEPHGGRHVEACHELFNINTQTRSIDDVFIPQFKLRSRMASGSLFAKSDTRRLFIIADDTMAAGSTMAEMFSFTQYFGGTVLAATTMAHRGYGTLLPDREIEAAFDRKYPKNSLDRKQLDSVLHAVGLTLEALTYFEKRSFTRAKPAFLELRDVEGDLKRAAPVAELTETQKLFLDAAAKQAVKLPPRA